MVSPETKPIAISIPWPYGSPLELELHVPEGKTTLVDVLPQIYLLGNAVIDRAVQESEGAGQRVSCQKGCDHCCHHFFSLSPYEAANLLRVVESMPGAQKRHVLQTMDDNYRTVEKAGLAQGVADLARRNPKRSQDELVSIALCYQRLRIPCPFLMRDACMIYEHRPMVCRCFMSVSNPLACKGVALKQAPQAVKLPYQLDVALRRFDGVGQCEQEGIPPILLRQWADKAWEAPQPREAGEVFLERYIALLTRGGAGTREPLHGVLGATHPHRPSYPADGTKQSGVRT